MAIWNNKERLVFLTLLCVLCLSIYRAFPKLSESTEAASVLPRKEVDESLLEPPPAALTPRKLGDWKIAYKPNPFWYLDSLTGPGGPANKQGNEDSNIALMQIQKTPKGYRAQLKTANSVKKWYYESEPFESYKLLKIDPVAETCEVYSERLGKTILLRKSR